MIDAKSLTDENGKPSSGRRHLLGWSFLAALVLLVDVYLVLVADPPGISPRVYDFLERVLVVLVVWIALPRAGEKWAPALAGVLAAIPAALANVGGSTVYSGRIPEYVPEADTGEPGGEDEYTGRAPGGGG